MHSLMKDASIPDFVKTGGDAIPLSRGIDGRPRVLTGCVRGGAERGINVLLERFRLDMTDEDAVQHFQDLMDESVTSLMPKLCVPAPLGARRRWPFVCGGALTECVCGQDGGCARLGYLLEVRRCWRWCCCLRGSVNASVHQWHAFAGSQGPSVARVIPFSVGRGGRVDVCRLAPQD